jgi:hypothetical protein
LLSLRIELIQEPKRLINERNLNSDNIWFKNLHMLVVLPLNVSDMMTNIFELIKSSLLFSVTYSLGG